MTPIERACRALAELHGRNPDEPVLIPNGRPLWQDFEPQVRVVVAAIGEPTEAMVQAGDKADYECDEGVDISRLGVDPAIIYRAMIDKVLEEGR